MSSFLRAVSCVHTATSNIWPIAVFVRLSLTVPSNELANILGVSVVSPRSASKVVSSVVVDFDVFFFCFIVRRLEL